jgi:hypothetical protein
MNDIKKITIIGFLSYLYDICKDDYYKDCITDINIQVSLLLHHIFNIYTQFGWLSNNKYILFSYLLIPIGVLIHWRNNNNKCVYTQIVNKHCNIPENNLFRDIWYLLGIKELKNYDQIHETYLIIVWFITLIKLFKFVP